MKRTTREKSADFSVPRKKQSFFLWKCGVSMKTHRVFSVLENSRRNFLHKPVRFTIKPKVYKTKKSFNSAKLNPKKILEDCKRLKCAVKMCDGSYHVVNSDLQEVLEQNKQLVKNGFVNELLGIFPKEARGSRFLVFHPENSESAFLLGDVETTLKMLAGK